MPPRTKNHSAHSNSYVLPASLVVLTLILAVTTVRAIDHHREAKRHFQPQPQPQGHKHKYETEAETEPQPNARRSRRRSRRGSERTRFRRRDYGYGVDEDVYADPPPPYEYGQYHDHREGHGEARHAVPLASGYHRPQMRAIDDGREDWSDDASTLVDGYGYEHGHRGRSRR